MEPSYRPSLRRIWDADLPVVGWIGLNPSTASQRIDDPTTRRVQSFSRAWGFGGYHLVNLFPLRTPYPRVLRAQSVAIRRGPDPDGPILELLEQVNEVVVAWGNHGADGLLRGRCQEVRGLLTEWESSSSGRVVCLGLTAAGQPRHPGRIAASTLREPFVLSQP